MGIRMYKKPISDVFKQVGVTLVNPQWSWGGVTDDLDVLFLRIWTDQSKKFDGKLYARITDYKKRKAEEGKINLGWKERLEHLELMKEGITTYCIKCKENDKDSTSGRIRDYDDTICLVGGDLMMQGGDYWLEIVGSEKIRNIVNKRKQR